VKETQEIHCEVVIDNKVVCISFLSSWYYTSFSLRVEKDRV